jgi:hypothetical protein
MQTCEKVWKEDKILKMHEYEPVQAVKFIPTHAFVTSIQINHFRNFRFDCPSWHLVKMTYSHINDYKVVCNCICILYL